MAAAEIGDEVGRGGFVHPLQRERCQLQAGNPALGACRQRVGRRGRQRQAHRLAEKSHRLGRGEAQVIGAQLDNLATGAQPRQRQRRILTRQQQQVEGGGAVVEQKLHGLMNQGGW